MSVQHQLSAEHELRFEVRAGHSATLTLLDGTAEVFGVELVPGTAFTFRGGANVAVFTWHGARIALAGLGTDAERAAALGMDDGGASSSSSVSLSSSATQSIGGEGAAQSIVMAYAAEDTPMVSYANLHAMLEARRAAAAARLAAGSGSVAETAGPRVLVCGPTDVGKSSLVAVLLAYAVRVGRRPTLVDLDPGQGALCVPGTLCATPVDRASLSVEGGGGVGGGGTLGNAAAAAGQGGNAAHTAEPASVDPVPLCYFLGHASPAENVALARTLTSRLASVVRQRDERDPDARVGGIVVNTSGWVDGPDAMALLHHAVAELAIDTVLVLGNDRLHAQLATAYGAAGQAGAVAGGRPAAAVTVMKAPRSEGVVIRDRAARARARSARLRRYFYGAPAAPLSPEPLLVQFGECQIFRCGGKAALTTSAMNPMGQASMLDPHNFSAVGSVNELKGCVLAVLHAPAGFDDEAVAARVAAAAAAGGGEEGAAAAAALPLEQLVLSNVAGFVHVTDVDAEMGTLTLLSPCPGDLPSNYLLAGSVAWLDDN
jgi:polyribonucleotide 5'-hydroxyl-kinase